MRSGGPRIESLDNTQYGLHYAIVCQNKDPEKLGRVKVKVPILSESDSSHWAPIIMLGAGKTRGWFFIPEVNDEVLVMYEHGDMRRRITVVFSMRKGCAAASLGGCGGIISVWLSMETTLTADGGLLFGKSAIRFFLL